jgi:outer membrane protein
MKLQSILLSFLLIIATGIPAQDKPQQWDLTTCINYALTNNIQIQKSKITLEQSKISTKLAKAQLFPNLSGSINQNFTNYPIQTAEGSTSSTYSGNYGLSSSLLLFDGGKTLKNIRQQKLLEQIGQFNVQYSQKTIQFSILQSYLQLLYASETVNIDSATVEVSKFQFERGGNLLKAGSISKVDVAKLESQYSSDKYQLVVAKNNLETQKINLKQLLEMKVEDQLSIAIPVLSDFDILKPLPTLQSIYATSLNVMPQLKSSKLNIQVAGLETEKARAGYMPKINLNAAIGTNHSTISSLSFNKQLQDGFNDGIGLSVSIPIFTNRANKSAVETDLLNERASELNLRDAEKSLLTEVESSYQDALSAQSQYIAAQEKVKALQTSYDLIDQQFTLGLKNTLDLLTEKNNLLAAKQGLLQAKYLSIMNVQMLNLYQDFPLEIK